MPNANGREESTNEPRMNQPSREAMAGKLQIYADRGRLVERCLACEADSGRHHKAVAFRQSSVKVVVSKTYYYEHHLYANSMSRRT